MADLVKRYPLSCSAATFALLLAASWFYRDYSEARIWECRYRLSLTPQDIDTAMFRVRMDVERQASQVELGQSCELHVVLSEAE